MTRVSAYLWTSLCTATTHLISNIGGSFFRIGRCEGMRSGGVERRKGSAGRIRPQGSRQPLLKPREDGKAGSLSLFATGEHDGMEARLVAARSGTQDLGFCRSARAVCAFVEFPERWTPICSTSSGSLWMRVRNASSSLSPAAQGRCSPDSLVVRCGDCGRVPRPGSTCHDASRPLPFRKPSGPTTRAGQQHPHDAFCELPETSLTASGET
jgi:hypothetical protein